MKATGSDFALIAEASELASRFTSRWVSIATKEFQKKFPSIPIKEVDERFTSKLASQAMLQMGLKKKQRQNKAMLDEIAATIMLQEYLQHYL